MIQVIQKAALAGGEVLLKYFRQEQLQISNKTTHQNIVTQADIEAQKIIHTTIVDELKKLNISEDQIGFIGEEKLHKKGEHTFVIDPLDGTSNFATGVDQFGVLIGYMHDQELLAGIIYLPIQNELFIGESGKGAYSIKNGKKQSLISISNDLKNTFIYTSVSFTEDIEFGTNKKIMNLKNLFRGVRIIGSVAVDFKYMLEGAAGLIMIGATSIWDLAGPRIILKEAGFEMYDRNWNPLIFDLSEPMKKYPFFACDPKYKDQLAKVLMES